MNVSLNGIAFTQGFEGCVLTAYQDSVGIWTIGWGATSIFGRPVKKGDMITQQQADDFLTATLAEVAVTISPWLSNVSLNQNQFDSQCDFAYNAGPGALKGSTLLKTLLADPADPYITACFMMWDKGHVNGQLVVIPGLESRRQKEANLYFS
jgi:GH24 family phage-related lysozyme (muramidase)